MTNKARSGILLLIILAALASGPRTGESLATTGIPERRFGVVESYAAPQAASALGAGWTRVTFFWNQIQPDGPDQWNVAPIPDAVLNHELASGREVVGLLVTTPGWATDHAGGPGVPRGLDLPVDHPDNLWANFVRTIVSRYAGRIDRWIIWNEPDIPSTYHMSWGGSVDSFVRLLQVAYLVTKETNPRAVVHMAAVTHYWDEHWYGRFLDTLTADPHAAAHNYYFDVATLHIYFQTDIVYDITRHYTNMMRGRGIHKPVWIVETNAAPSRDPAWPVPSAQFDVSLDQQAAYIIQAMSLSIAAGAERVAVYKMTDTDSDRAANPEPFGLVRTDGSRRPAFTAYRTAATHLAGFRGGTWDRRDDVSQVTIDRGAQTTTVLWARGGEVSQTAYVPARANRALLVDMRGSARTVYPDGDTYVIELPPAVCMRGCQIGGPPYMLVEQAPAGAGTSPLPVSPTLAPPTPPANPATEPPTEVVRAETPTAAALDPTTTVALSLTEAEPTETALSPTPTSTATASPTYTVTPATPATATFTPTPTLTPTVSPTPPATPAPELSPTPTPPPSAVADPPWVVVGALVYGIVGMVAAVIAVISVARARRAAQKPDSDEGGLAQRS